MELTTRQENMPAVLDGYVQQGQFFLGQAVQNLVQYGRVLTEAKPLVPHGHFEEWVEKNFKMSARSAQNYMAVWERFGKNERLQNVQFGNLQKMLALPEGTEEKFVQDNDLENMKTREVEEAVKKVRQEAERAIRREREAREVAEQRAKAAELKQKEPDRGLIAQLAEKNAALENAQREAEKAYRTAQAAQAELNAVRADLAETEEMLSDNQQEYNRLQAELLDAKSAAARGDAEKSVGNQLTAEGFAAAVRAFLGSVVQVPFMGAYFGSLTDHTEIRQWEENLRAVADFCERAEEAMQGKGGVIDV